MNDSRKLKMSSFQRHEIPINIQELEFKQNTSCLTDFNEHVKNMREDVEAYNEAFSGMIYMEEAANSVEVSAYNMHKVNIEIHSQVQRKIKIKIKRIT